MTLEIKVPTFPESVAEGEIATWHFKEGDAVSEGDVIVEIETDKVVMEVPAITDGVVGKILKAEGQTVVSEEVIGALQEGAAPAKAAKTEPKPSAQDKAEKPEPVATEKPAEKSASQPAASSSEPVAVDASPAARRRLNEQNLSADQVQQVLAGADSNTQAPGVRIEKRVPMTRLRKTVAKRLLEVQQSNALLTTFNEVDMYAVMNLRKQYKDQFEKVHGVRLGFMSFFLKATCEALKQFPAVNASIDGEDIVYHGYYDIGVAVASPRGLVVPVVRNVDQISMAEIEQAIRDYAGQARGGSLEIADMQGGTFTITNGGTFGSMLSTPIVNAPQSAILGMHNIVERPVAINGEVKIRPIMYLALSYDHRIIDGSESVSFLKTIKEYIENPSRMLLQV
jgi:2-oxoglutarate dehydrogenase E2 component (dihydrolipoamide succinyltransferase)